jgi:hypothetical protein
MVSDPCSSSVGTQHGAVKAFLSIPLFSFEKPVIDPAPLRKEVFASEVRSGWRILCTGVRVDVSPVFENGPEMLASGISSTYFVYDFTNFQI